MKYPTTLLLCLIALPVSAQTYQTHNPFASEMLTIKQSEFIIDTVGASGNLCYLEGQIKNNTWQDGDGCRIHFRSAWNSISIAIPEKAKAACSTYCGHNTFFDKTYYRLPTACTKQAAVQTEQRFQTAYRKKHFQSAIRIKQTYLKQCGEFMHLVDRMRTRNDLAVSYKNAGNPAACRRVLQPLTEYMDNKEFQPSYIYRDEYERELKHTRFNRAACK